MTEPDIALVGCAVVGGSGKPNVPSDVWQCRRCGADVWVSRTLLDDLHSMGHADDTIHAYCLFTCLVIPDDTRPEMTEGQMEALRARGMSDKQIEEAYDFFDSVTQRGDHDA